MNTLQQNWLTEGLIDYEYKKYVLLSYLQQVSRYFDEKKLYPRLSELLEHYQHLQIFKNKKMAVANDFPKQISKLDFEKFKVEYEKLFQEDELMREIDSVVEFALPEIENKLSIGKELYEEVEEHLAIFSIGIQPLRTEEGYFFLSDFLKKLVYVYFYQISIFENLQEKYRGIHTQFLFQYNISIADSYERVKTKLIEENKHLPNPAAYAVEFKSSYPLPETMLPIAKRSLVRFVANA